MTKVLFAADYPKNFVSVWKHLGYQIFDSKNPLDEMGLSDMVGFLKREIEDHDIEMIFSFDYCPNLGQASYDLGLIYISWALDCPHAPLWSKTSRYPNQYLFVFDKKQYRMLLARGMKNVYYLPICTDVDGFLECIRLDDGKSREKFGTDVAFVGNLYNDPDHSIYDSIHFQSQYLKGYLESLMNIQRKIWGVDLIGECVNDKVWKELKKEVIWDLNNQYEDDVYEVMMTNIFGQKIAQLERMEACSYLAEHFQFALYTDSDTSFCKKIENRGHVDYISEMPLVFHYSKINIHITLRSIPSGMSLRVLDVLACGGFLLTNYQPEIAEYFVDGEELVMYSDFEDMYEKIAYYLSHEEERQRIAEAGFQKVNAMFRYENGVRQIVEVLGQSGKENSDCI